MFSLLYFFGFHFSDSTNPNNSIEIHTLSSKLMSYSEVLKAKSSSKVIVILPYPQTFLFFLHNCPHDAPARRSCEYVHWKRLKPDIKHKCE